MLCKTILIDWFLKRYEIWNLWNVITNLKWIYRIIFGGQNEKIGHDISDLLRPNCPLDRLTNDNNSKIKPDNTNKLGTMASTFFGILPVHSTIFVYMSSKDYLQSPFWAKDHWKYALYFREGVNWKKNVLFRALPELPKPPPHDPNSGNLVLFFRKSKFKIWKSVSN